MLEKIKFPTQEPLFWGNLALGLVAGVEMAVLVGRDKWVLFVIPAAVASISVINGIRMTRGFGDCNFAPDACRYFNRCHCASEYRGQVHKNRGGLNSGERATYRSVSAGGCKVFNPLSEWGLSKTMLAAAAIAGIMAL